MKLKKIAYIELDTHPEILSNFMDLMNDSQEFEVDYFISEKIDQLRFSQSSNIHIVTSESILHKMNQQSYDLVIIGTIHRYFSTFKKLIHRYKTVAIVHNLNFSKSKSFELFQNIWKDDLVFRTKLLLKEGLLLAPNISQTLKHQLVLDQSFENNRRKYFPIFYNQIKSERKSLDRLHIVVPGTVSQQRRDYKHILKSLQDFQNQIKVTFLGKASGTELAALKKAEEMLPKNIQIQFFTEKLSGEDFGQYMADAHVLWCPVQSKTQFMGVDEVYGQTKMSGNIGDAIKFGKPAIFPSTYRSNFDFIFSEEKDVESQLFRISNLKFNFDVLQKELVLDQLEKVLKDLI